MKARARSFRCCTLMLMLGAGTGGSTGSRKRFANSSASSSGFSLSASALDWRMIYRKYPNGGCMPYLSSLPSARNLLPSETLHRQERLAVHPASLGARVLSLLLLLECTKAAYAVEMLRCVNQNRTGRFDNPLIWSVPRTLSRTGWSLDRLRHSMRPPL